MDLKTYVTGLTPEGRKTFCREADIPESYLSSILSETASKRSAGAKTCAYIYAASDKQVMFEDVRDDLISDAFEHVKAMRKSSRGKAAA